MRMNMLKANELILIAFVCMPLINNCRLFQEKILT